MRLNFSGVGEDEIREGVRRIGKAIGEQVELYGALTSKSAGSPAPAQPQEPDTGAAELPRPGGAGDGGDVLPFRRSGEGAA
jgi:2-aminoadipate transaminase